MGASAAGPGPYLKFSCQSIDIHFFEDLGRQGWKKREDGVGYIFLTLQKSRPEALKKRFSVGGRSEKKEEVKRQ